MTHRSDKLLLWSPRILGIGVCVFLPMLVLSAVVGLSWWRPWLGGLIFTGLAVAYAYFARDHASWIAVVAVPLLLVGILSSWSWMRHRELRRNA